MLAEVIHEMLNATHGAQLWTKCHKCDVPRLTIPHEYIYTVEHIQWLQKLSTCFEPFKKCPIHEPTSKNHINVSVQNKAQIQGFLMIFNLEGSLKNW